MNAIRKRFDSYGKFRKKQNSRCHISDDLLVCEQMSQENSNEQLHLSEQNLQKKSDDPVRIKPKKIDSFNTEEDFNVIENFNVIEGGSNITRQQSIVSYTPNESDKYFFPGDDATVEQRDEIQQPRDERYHIIRGLFDDELRDHWLYDLVCNYANGLKKGTKRRWLKEMSEEILYSRLHNDNYVLQRNDQRCEEISSSAAALIGTALSCHLEPEVVTLLTSRFLSSKGYKVTGIIDLHQTNSFVTIGSCESQTLPKQCFVNYNGQSRTFTLDYSTIYEEDYESSVSSDEDDHSTCNPCSMMNCCYNDTLSFDSNDFSSQGIASEHSTISLDTMISNVSTALSKASDSKRVRRRKSKNRFKKRRERSFSSKRSSSSKGSSDKNYECKVSSKNDFLDRNDESKASSKSDLSTSLRDLVLI